MNILLVNTSDNTGGAAVACSRLMNALTRQGVEVRMLVRDKATDDSRVRKVRAPWWKALLDAVTPGGSWCKAVERVLLLPFCGWSWRRAWTVDVNALGTDITHTEDFEWADVIHLHWVNQGMLSMGDIKRVVASGKRVVWTMHDLWPLSSVYHYAQEERMPLLEWWAMAHKRHAYCKGSMTFVTCSRWLMRQAEDSPLLRLHDSDGRSLHDILSIPNPIDMTLFSRKANSGKVAIRHRLGLPEDRRVVLFVSQKVTDERKGARYFVEAMNAISKENAFEKVHVAILGGGGEEIAAMLSCPCTVLGYVTDQQQIVDVYNAADCFVLPSLNDNLPNTIMEAMACGVPCVGFDIGGIPEMIDNGVTGVIAEPRNVRQLRDGILCCLSEQHHAAFSDACVEKVRTTYSMDAVARRFMEVYGRRMKQ